MKTFAAPLIEHRDALDHIMRYMNEKDSNGLTDKAIEELTMALGHETRAFFDIADYICIQIRFEISESLRNIKSTQINSIWANYSEDRARVFNISEGLVDIRRNRRGNRDFVNQYKPLVDELFAIYKKFKIDIEPNLKKSYLRNFL